MKNFFRYVTELPEGSGFAMFGTCHRLWLVSIMTVSAVAAFIYKRTDDKGREKIRRFFGVVMPFIAIYRDFVLIITGHFDRFYLPLHLCGMALWIGALYCFTRWRFAGVVYVLLCVPGALSALIYPDWTAYPLWNYMHIHDFISHGLIVLWGICLIVSEEVLPLWREIWMPVLFGLSGVIILTPVNKLLGTNYWFLETPSEGSPLVIIMRYTGDRWYVVGYILFVLLIVSLWMLLIRCVRMWADTVGRKSST